MSGIRILKAYREVEPFIGEVQLAADSNRQSLGFLPKVVYHDLAAEGRLWVALDSESRVAGFLTFGGRFLQIGVKQLFVASEFRKRGVGGLLVNELVKYAEQRNYLSIKARVASDLSDSNAFWERMGFELVRRESGGKSRNREILVRVRLTRSPSLLDAVERAPGKRPAFTEALASDPELLKPVKHFSLDLNVLLDVAQGREDFIDTGLLFGSAMSGLVRLSVSHELLLELKRARPQSVTDPVLEFASTLPVLPKYHRDLDEVVGQLLTIVFPKRKTADQLTPREQSDLLHIAAAIQCRLDGFVTRDQALLDAADQIRSKFKVEVVSPAELVEPKFDDGLTSVPVTVMSSTSDLLAVQPLQGGKEMEAVQFLADCGYPEQHAARIIDRGTSARPREVHVAFLDRKPIAVCSWDRPTPFHEVLESHVVVDESARIAQRVIDHFLELLVRVAACTDVPRLQIELLTDQPQTLATAQSRGFVESRKEGTRLIAEKPMAGRVVTESEWAQRSANLMKHTGIGLPTRAPKFADFDQIGVDVQDFRGRRLRLNRFDLETILAPVLFLFSDLSALIIPIRELFARDLLGEVGDQFGLLPSSEAVLRIAKAYFRSPYGTTGFKRGAPAVFYVSGRGGGAKAAIGVARITSSEIRTVEEAGIAYERQGVLDTRELTKMAKQGQVHVITFDNFKKFDSFVPYARLAALYRLKANLQVPQAIDGKTLARICEEGFS